MELEQLRKFLIDSNNAGYASGKPGVKEPDGSTTINFEKDGWRSNDNFFGGEPYGGRTAVFYKGKPEWIMVYYGYVVEGANFENVYKILRGALMEMPEAHPYRGPAEFKQGQFVYRNSWTGELDKFFGEEKIYENDALAYKANYMGGLIDQNR